LVHFLPVGEFLPCCCKNIKIKILEPFGLKCKMANEKKIPFQQNGQTLKVDWAKITALSVLVIKLKMKNIKTVEILKWKFLF